MDPTRGGLVCRWLLGVANVGVVLPVALWLMLVAFSSDYSPWGLFWPCVLIATTAIVNAIVLFLRYRRQCRAFIRIVTVLLNAAVAAMAFIDMLPLRLDDDLYGNVVYVFLIVTAVLSAIAILFLPAPWPPPHCPRCGYDLSGAPHIRCPECGREGGVDEHMSKR